MKNNADKIIYKILRFQFLIIRWKKFILLLIFIIKSVNYNIYNLIKNSYFCKKILISNNKIYLMNKNIKLNIKY